MASPSKLLERFHKQGVTVVITVDTGITAFDEVEYANKVLGIRTVITDHHLPQGGQLPDAAAIVNRHLSDDTRLADFCGAATAFKLAIALLAETDLPPAPELIPLAAIGTLADQTELSGDNRIIVREGLKMLDNSAPPRTHRTHSSRIQPDPTQRPLRRRIRHLPTGTPSKRSRPHRLSRTQPETPHRHRHLPSHATRQSTRRRKPQSAEAWPTKHGALLNPRSKPHWETVKTSWPSKSTPPYPWAFWAP